MYKVTYALGSLIDYRTFHDPIAAIQFQRKHPGSVLEKIC
jgi:hypothetical protein